MTVGDYFRIFRMLNHFSFVEPSPPIETWRLLEMFNADTNPEKVNLGIGVYRDEEGKMETLPVVRHVEQKLSENGPPNKMYLEHVGLPSFCEKGLRLVFGDDSPCVLEQRALSIQSIGGTGALRIGFEFLFQNGYTTVYVPSPTWPNHKAVLKAIDIEVLEYRYWDSNKLGLDLDGLLEDLSTMPPRSVVLFHACAHNPTGSDPTQEQWMEIGKMVQDKQHLPFFDLAYQGLSSGDLGKYRSTHLHPSIDDLSRIDQDAWPIRYFANELKLELFVAQSFSKNFGLYSERVGQFIGVFCHSDVIPAFQSQVTTIIWSLYLTPPEHGARIVSTILNDPVLTAQWKSNVQSMHARIKFTRQQLYSKLLELNTPGMRRNIMNVSPIEFDVPLVVTLFLCFLGSWEHIIRQTGMFAYTNLSESQCQELVDWHSCYLTINGRINVCAITPKNVAYIAEQIHKVVTTPSDYLQCSILPQYFNGEEFETRRRGSHVSSDSRRGSHLQITDADIKELGRMYNMIRGASPGLKPPQPEYGLKLL